MKLPHRRTAKNPAGCEMSGLRAHLGYYKHLKSQIFISFQVWEGYESSMPHRTPVASRLQINWCHQLQTHQKKYRVPVRAWSWVEAGKDQITVKLQGKVRKDYVLSFAA